MLELLFKNGKTIIEYPDPQVLYAKTSTLFIVPTNTYSIHAVAIAGGYRAGGGLSWRNNIPVTPGEELIIQAGYGSLATIDSFIKRGSTFLLLAKGTVDGLYGGIGGKAAGGYNHGGGNGGAYGDVVYEGISGGGGGGGYAGNGGDGAARARTAEGDTIYAQPKPGIGGGGGGGGAKQIGTNLYWGPGGGTWPYGQGSNGVEGSMTFTSNNTARYGGQGSYSTGTIKNSSYGGGLLSWSQIAGCVRIIWGAGRSFPSNAADI